MKYRIEIRGTEFAYESDNLVRVAAQYRIISQYMSDYKSLIAVTEYGYPFDIERFLTAAAKFLEQVPQLSTT